MSGRAMSSKRQASRPSTVYERLPEIRALTPDSSSIEDAEPFMSALVTVAAFDLGQGRIDGFAAFRFFNGWSVQRRAPGSPPPFARRRRCRTSARTAQAVVAVDQRSRGDRARLVQTCAPLFPNGLKRLTRPSHAKRFSAET